MKCDLELARTHQYGLRLADHYHLCPKCGRRIDCDGPPCASCPCPNPTPPAAPGPLFEEVISQ